MERLTDVLVNAYDEYVEDGGKDGKYANLFMEVMQNEDPGFMWGLPLKLLKGSSNESLSEDERRVCRIFAVIFMTLVLEKFDINIKELFDSPKSDEVMETLTPEMGEEIMRKILKS